MSATETRKLTADINAARDPAEKFTREQNRLTEALNKGAISEETYNRLLDSKAEKLNKVDSSMVSYFAKIAAGYLSYQVLTSGIRSAIDAGQAFIEHIRETQAAIDETAKAAAMLGISFKDLSAIRFAAGEIGGLDTGQTDNAIKKMQIAIAKGVEGDKTISGAFAKLGLDAGRLMVAGPIESIKLIAGGMAGVNSQAEKLLIATELFGKGGADFVSTLEAGRGTIEESVAFQQRWNSLSDAQVLTVEAANDAWGRIGIAAEGVSTTLAAEMAPAMLVFAEHLLAAEVSSTQIYENMSLIVDAAAALAVAGVFGAGAGLDAIQEITDKRAEMENQARQKEIDRRVSMEKLIAEQKLEAEERNRERLSVEDQQDSHIRLNEEFQKREEMQRKLASSALDAANRYFEKERANQKKIRDDISKGPQSIEAGSSEAAKFFADQINAAIGKEVAPDQGAPTEEQLLTEAQKQSETQAKIEVKQAEQVELLKKILEKKPEVARLR